MFDPAMLQMLMQAPGGDPHGIGLEYLQGVGVQNPTPGMQGAAANYMSPQGGNMTGLLDMMSSKLGDMGKQQPPPMQSSYNPGQAYQAWLQMQNKKGLLR